MIHSVFIPAARFKQDAVPGREILQWVEVTKPGKYEIPCAELCGFGHSGMKGYLFVHAGGIPAVAEGKVAFLGRPGRTRILSRGR